MWATISNNNFVMLILVTSDKHEGRITISCIATGSQCKRMTNAGIELGSILAFVVRLH